MTPRTSRTTGDAPTVPGGDAQPLDGTAISPVIVPTSAGSVQVAEVGDPDAPAVICLHGSPGGWDQGVLMGRFLAEHGFRVIAPSRAGYLGTRLTHANDTPDRQADQLTALMDALGVDRAGVLAWSGGGPAAYRLAARHGHRVNALVAVAPVSEPFDWKIPAVDQFLMGTLPGQMVMRSLIAGAPRQIVAGLLRTEGALEPDEIKQRTQEIMDDPQRRAFALEVTRHASKRGGREAGVANDRRQFEAMGALGLEQISVPTMIVQGDSDTEIDLAESERAHARIRGSELVVVPRGTHMALYLDPGFEEAQERVRAFLREAART